MIRYFTAPALAGFLVAVSALTVLVTTLGLFRVELERPIRRLWIHAPTGVVQATVQATLAVALVLYVPAAAVLALEPFRSGSLGWILVGVWLTAVTSLVCSLGAPTIDSDAPPEPRLWRPRGCSSPGSA